MRARRLRHLGLIGGGDSSTSSVIHSEPELDDGNQHKQKQQRIDTDAQLESTLNNNDQTLESDTKTVSNCLTQRSRLLNDFGKQQLENRLNKNVKETGMTTLITETTNETVAMETDDSLEQSKDGDSEDSGIEKMETDEIVEKQPIEPFVKIIPDQAVSIELQQQEAEVCLSRILDAFWAEHCEGSIIVSETAAIYHIEENNSVHFDDLTFQIINEIIWKYFDGEICALAKPKYTEYEKQLLAAIENKDDTNENAQLSASGGDCSTPKMMPHNLPTQAALSHLIKSFNRCAQEEDRYNNSRNRNKFGLTVLNGIAVVRKQLISSSILMLDFKLKPDNHPYFEQCRSVLLTLLIEDEVPSDFLQLLFNETYKNPVTFKHIFDIFLNSLFIEMQWRVISKTIDTTPINILWQMTELTVDRTRPICDLITKLNFFNPIVSPGFAGRQIVKTSFLGPFLSLSVFSDENPKLAEDADENWESNLGGGFRMVSFFFFIFSLLTVYFITANNNNYKIIIFT